jgi:hypothetical protein
VCALCINHRGDKATRSVTDKEGEKIKEIRPGYDKTNQHYPAGICVSCIWELKRMSKGEPASFVLPESYTVTLPQEDATGRWPCVCNFCHLARLNGHEFITWRQKMKGKVKNDQAGPLRMCTRCYKPVQGVNHTCSVSKAEAVRNLAASLPEEVTAKLAHRYVASKVGSAGDQTPVFLPPAIGGRPVPVLYGKQPQPKLMQPLTHKEAITIGFQNNLSTNQAVNIFADLRTVQGRGLVEPGLAQAAIGLSYYLGPP